MMAAAAAPQAAPDVVLSEDELDICRAILESTYFSKGKRKLFCSTCKKGGLSVEIARRDHYDHQRFPILQVSGLERVRASDFNALVKTDEVAKYITRGELTYFLRQRQASTSSWGLTSSWGDCRSCKVKCPNTSMLEHQIHNVQNAKVCSIECLVKYS